MGKLDGIQTSQASDSNRIKTNGQVFTPDSIVNMMLDETDRKIAEYFEVESISLVSDNDYIEYTILEPTCGNGNFLIRILDRKLERVARYSGIKQEIALLKAVSSIYAIELTAENVVNAKLRMMEVIENGSTPVFELEYKKEEDFRTSGFKLSSDIKQSVQYILDRNILCGNSLTYEHILTWKANHIESIWNMDRTQLDIADSVIKSDIVDAELSLTQYDFDETLVAIRERSYRNMHSTSEIYNNESEYVKYNKIYELPRNKIYVDYELDTFNSDEFDF